MILSHVSTIILYYFYVFCQTNLLTICIVPVSCFCCLFVSEIYFWKYSRNWIKIYGDYFYAKTKTESEGQPGRRPTGQRSPPAASQGGPTGGARPYPVGTPSVPSDAYKIPINLKTSGRPLFSAEDIPTCRHLKP